LTNIEYHHRYEFDVWLPRSDFLIGRLVLYHAAGAPAVSHLAVLDYLVSFLLAFPHVVFCRRGSMAEQQFTSRQITREIGCEISGLDVRRLADPAILGEVKKLIGKHHMLVFKDQKLGAQDLVDFTRYFGEPDSHILKQYTHRDHPDVYVISNVEDRQANVNDVSLNWHTDLAYKAHPSAYVILLAEKVPEVGADTCFASMQRVYNEMTDAEKAKLRGRLATYSFTKLHAKRRKMHPDAAPLTSQQVAESPDVYHPVLRRHPDTGEEILYVNLPDCAGIEGMPDEEALGIVQSLFDRITDPAHVHRHKWAVGDLVIWDNRTLLHSASWFDAEHYQRRMLRTCVRGEKPMSSVSVASAAE
jgi:taurine dioxygenase